VLVRFLDCPAGRVQWAFVHKATSLRLLYVRS